MRPLPSFHHVAAADRLNVLDITAGHGVFGMNGRPAESAPRSWL
jgi:hypothetical protein